MYLVLLYGMSHDKNNFKKRYLPLLETVLVFRNNKQHHPKIKWGLDIPSLFSQFFSDPDLFNHKVMKE